MIKKLKIFRVNKKRLTVVNKYNIIIEKKGSVNMAVKLRLKRMGSKKKPAYRIVAIDSHNKRDGEYIELIGTYNPLTEPKTLNVNEEVAIKWLKNGAIPSDTVRNLLSEVGIMKKFHELKKEK